MAALTICTEAGARGRTTLGKKTCRARGSQGEQRSGRFFHGAAAKRKKRNPNQTYKPLKHPLLERKIAGGRDMEKKKKAALKKT